MGVLSRTAARRFAACFMATLIFCEPTHAQIDIGFGLDSGTRNLIQSLPANIRQQIETAGCQHLAIIPVGARQRVVFQATA